MRSYGRRFTKKSQDKHHRQRRETDQGIIWSLDDINQLAVVRIQGSAVDIRIPYPRGLMLKPEWLRKGNAVIINYRSGIRGLPELLGQGWVIPTPVSGATLPDTELPGDAILTGFVVTAFDTPALGVLISSGTYRIAGIVYSYISATGEYFVMDTHETEMGAMDTWPAYAMDQISFAVDAAPAAGYFRYDCLFIGADGVIDYSKGAEVTSYPVMPDTPTDHLLIEFILRCGGDTTVTTQRIGQTWKVSTATSLQMTVPDTLAWSLITDYPEVNIVFTIKDQYGNSFPCADPLGHLLVLTKIAGTGQIYSATTGYHADEVQQRASYTYTFKYQRDQTISPEVIPMFHGQLSQTIPLYSFDTMSLLDSGGDPI